MKKTNYTTIKEGSAISVLEDGKAFTKGFTDVESAMHSIYVTNGKVVGHFYHSVDSEVFLEVKDEN